jgi:uncharacterized protein
MSEPNESMCAKPGRFSWNELVTPQPATASSFYGKLFGWKSAPFTPPGTPAGSPPYTVFRTDPADPMGVGGMAQAVQPGAPAQWVPYVVVANADASLTQAAALGAKVLLPVMSIPEVGRIAVIQDPQGATLGLHEPPK